jgi:DNA transformation protein
MQRRGTRQRVGTHDGLCPARNQDYSLHMPVSDDYLQYVLEQLAGLGHISPRRLFGGVGLYHEDRIFALIFRDILYFKVDDSTRSDYETRGMDRFRPYADKPLWSMTYYAVPAEILEDADECTLWGRKSLRVAVVTSKPAARQTKKRRR